MKKPKKVALSNTLKKKKATPTLLRQIHEIRNMLKQAVTSSPRHLSPIKEIENTEDQNVS